MKTVPSQKYIDYFFVQVRNIMVCAGEFAIWYTLLCRKYTIFYMLDFEALRHFLPNTEVQLQLPLLQVEDLLSWT